MYELRRDIPTKLGLAKYVDGVDFIPGNTGNKAMKGTDCSTSLELTPLYFHRGGSRGMRANISFQRIGRN